MEMRGEGREMMRMRLEGMREEVMVSDAVGDMNEGDGVWAELWGGVGEVMGVEGGMEVGVVEGRWVVVGEGLGVVGGEGVREGVGGGGGGGG
ncbi:hypothetical protein, partial [Dermacoccus nishinomiyaensis]|uniref:hypothetical protein n=1 Tax=Dermacoccus nishinomiyaensis TaxID=1274 RepID=UPI001C92BC2D